MAGAARATPAEPRVRERARTAETHGHPTAGPALALAALGVVFGDIGTSPLYALHAVFGLGAGHHRVPVQQDTVLGVISLVLWSVTVIVSIKYVTLVMRADNDGEGGIMALIALVRRVGARRRAVQAVLVVLGVFGASLFYGDGMITPAISVLSAVEGLEVAAPSLESLVVPITLTILTALFAIQRFGTAAVGRLFGPIMALWFTALAVAGARHVLESPGILRAASPTYAVAFLVEHGGTAFVALAGVVLTVTGAEALYADMGHFGAPAIRHAWFAIVFPALGLNYLGQGALLLSSPRAVANPFFLLFPSWARIAMVMLATAATVIASQAVISGAFSVTRQAVQLGFLPRLTIRHTSQSEAGQVFVPVVNWGIFGAVVALVVGFGSSAALASAYGIAVTGTLAIDTLLFFFVVRQLWHKPRALVLAGAAAFLTVDLTFFSANLTKVVHGGWFPLVIALVSFVLLTTWQRGREIVTRNRTTQEGPLRGFVEEVRGAHPPLARVPGTAVFLNANPQTTPLALRANVEHNRVLHESVVILSIESRPVPHVREEERIEIDALGYRDDGIALVRVRVGFQDDVDVPSLLAECARRGLEREVDLECPSYFLSRMTIVPGAAREMRPWRKRLFMAMSRNSASPIGWFRLPDDRTVVMGSTVEL